MNYIVFDLEFNQDSTIPKEERTMLAEGCPFEIIQLGAVKLNNNLEIVSTFNRLVKPVIYKKLSPYVQAMTGFNMDILSKEDNFDAVYEDFVDFVGKDKGTFVVWGRADIKELYRNIKYHHLDWELMPKEYIDIQRYASKHFKLPKGINLGLGKAVELLGISVDENFHDAFGDASYTEKVFKCMDGPAIKPSIYDPHKAPVPKPVKHNIDFPKLFLQIEKMYGRGMSSEEKSIIELAYMMGKTGQFSK